MVASACGDDDTAPAASSAPPDASATLPTVPPTSGGQAAGYDYATGADDVVIDVSYEGGFVPADMLFARTPVAMVVGDGRVLSTGPVIAIYPGPLLPNAQQASITPEGIQQLLALADELGLLTQLEYERNDRIADAQDTVVTINVNGETYQHRAYALGMEPETGARADLAEFVTAMTDLESTIGDQVGPTEPYVPDTFLVRATPIDLEAMTFEVEPTVVPWPQDISIRLADAAECAELPAEEAQALFADANQLTFFMEGDATYQVAAVPQVPGRTC